VLNVQVVPNPGAPHVVSVTNNDGTTPAPLGGASPISPLQDFTVQFDQAVNLQQLAYQAYLQLGENPLTAVFVRGSDGLDYYPRLLSYNATTFQAQFQMLDQLPNGPSELHLAGRLGLDNLGGTPLAGNDPSGDYVVHFNVAGSSAGSGSGQTWTDQEPNDTPGQAQDLGTLFPRSQLQAGITITRDFSSNPASAPSDTGDYYQFTVLQARQYNFILVGSGMPDGTAAVVTDLNGNVVSGTPSFVGGGAVTVASIQTPGTYLVYVGGWSPSQAAGVKYQLHISIGQAPDNPVPLTVGSAPALSIRLTNGPTGGLPTLPILPPSTGNVPGVIGPGDLPALANLLPSSVLARGAIGGITAPDGGAGLSGGTALAQAPLSLGSNLLPLLILTQLDAGGEDPDPVTNVLPSWAEKYIAPLRESWGQALDILFRFGGWLETPPVPSPAPVPRIGTGAEEFELEELDDLQGAAYPDSFSAPGFMNESAWAGAVAALALVHSERRRDKGTPARPQESQRGLGTVRR
jgi:hypothetical protein